MGKEAEKGKEKEREIRKGRGEVKGEELRKKVRS